MIIACQADLEFEEVDKPAMAARLNVYHFKSLKQVNPSAFEWIRNHPVQCIVYAIKQAQGLKAEVSSFSGIITQIEFRK